MYDYPCVYGWVLGELEVGWGNGEGAVVGVGHRLDFSVCKVGLSWSKIGCRVD